jgi:uncharacterized protein with HEPN domain
MKRDWYILLEDIKTCCYNINDFVKDMDFEKFRSDIRTRDAVIRNFEVMGEAVKLIPQDIKKKFPQIDWKGMARLRDVLIHQYFGINYKILWECIMRAPEIRNQIDEALKTKPKDLF